MLIDGAGAALTMNITCDKNFKDPAWMFLRSLEEVNSIGAQAPDKSDLHLKDHSNLG